MDKVTESLKEQLARFLNAIHDDKMPLGDVCRACCGGVIARLGEQPRDAGLESVKSVQFSFKDDASDKDRRILLIVRGVQRGGTDVISFTASSQPELAIGQFLLDAANDCLEWRPDSKPGVRSVGLVDYVAGTNERSK